jgi:glycosyltransferase involved in cell wall biosynthesis
MVAYTFYETDNRVRRYAETLAKRGDAVDAIVLGREGQADFELVGGVHVHRIQKRVRNERGPFSYLLKLLLFFIRSTIALAVRHLSAPYDLIHVHSVPDFQVFSTLIPRLMGARVILDIHDIVPEFYASKFGVDRRSLSFRLLLLVEKLSIAYSSHVIIANHLWYRTLTERAVKPKKCTTVLNYPDLSIFSRRPCTVNTSEFVMCYPGTLNWHQGLDIAIEAVALLRKKAPHLRLLIIGDGPDREKLARMIEQQELQDCVKMIGSITIDEVADRMAQVDLGVVPKRKNSFGNEAFSTKIMEFMAMGVPVVAANTRIDTFYFNDHLVQFFESGSAADLADRVLELIENPARRETLRENALAFIGSNNWDVKKNEYLSLVDQLLGRDSAVTKGVAARTIPCTAVRPESAQLETD